MAVDVSGLIEQVYDEAIRIRDEALDAVLEDARADAPVSPITPTNDHSGQLRDSLQIFDTTDDPPIFAGAIGSPLDYAEFTDEVDTSPHIIRARNAPLLRFWWEDGPAGPDIYYFLYVRHPGTTGQRWFESHQERRWDTALREAAR